MLALSVVHRMSIPKFNLSKLRESVAQQQSVTRKDIANLLLLDRLQSMVKKQSFQKKKVKPQDNFVTISIYFQVTSHDGEFYIFDDETLRYKSYTINEANILKYLIFDKGNNFDNSVWGYSISSNTPEGISSLFLSNENIKTEVDMYVDDIPPFEPLEYIHLLIKIPLKVAIHNLKEYRSSYAEDKDQIIPQYSEEMGKWKEIIESLDNTMEGFYREFFHNKNESNARDIIRSFNNQLDLIDEVMQYGDEDRVSNNKIYPDSLTLQDAENLKLPKVVGLEVSSVVVA